MTKKQKKVPVVKEDDKARNKLYATVALKPSLLATSTVIEYTKILGELDIGSLNAKISDEINCVHSGDLKFVEAMLVSQAITLESIFHGIAKRANSNAGNMDTFERLLRLGLKAQSQSRATLETLGKIKNPQPIAFVRQANIAHGHQQVNNGDVPRTQENISVPNELLGDEYGKRMDIGASCSAIAANSELETVGSIHRAKD